MGASVTSLSKLLLSPKEPLFITNPNIGENEQRAMTVRKLSASFWKRDEFAVMIDGVYSESECLELIKMSERYLDYIEPENESLRSNCRAMMDSIPISDHLYHRILPYLPRKWSGKSIDSLNERLRFLKYKKGDEFKAYFDGEYLKKSGELSFLTVLLYLNEDFEGGHTVFLSPMHCNYPDHRLPVKPRTGSVLVFQHKRMLHCGSAIRNDKIKYCVRTDVMFK